MNPQIFNCQFFDRWIWFSFFTAVLLEDSNVKKPLESAQICLIPKWSFPPHSILEGAAECNIPCELNMSTLLTGVFYLLSRASQHGTGSFLLLSSPWGPLNCTPTTRATLCCTGDVPEPLFWVLQLVRHRASFPTLGPLWQGVGVITFPSHMPRDGKWGESGSALLLSRPQGWHTCVPTNQVSSSALPSWGAGFALRSVRGRTSSFCHMSNLN